MMQICGIMVKKNTKNFYFKTATVNKGGSDNTKNNSYPK